MSVTEDAQAVHSDFSLPLLPSVFSAQLIELLHEAVVVTDASRRIVFLNAAAERMFGRSSSVLLGGHLESLLPERLRSAHARHVDEFGRESNATRFMALRRPVVALRSDGVEIPVQISITSVHLLAGSYFAAVIRDLADLEREQMARQTSEDRYRLLFEEALEGILETSTDLRVIETNPAVLRMFGVAADVEWSQSSAASRVVDPHALTLLMDELANEGVARQHVLNLRRIDGSTFWGSVTAQLVQGRADEEQRVRLRIVDVSDRVEADQVRRESEARFRSVLEHTVDPVIVLNIQGEIDYASPSAQRLLGHVIGEGRLDADAWLRHVHPDDAALAPADFKDLRSPTNEFEFRILGHAGEYIDLFACIVDLRGDQTLEGFIVHVRDVTAQRRAEAALIFNGLHDSLSGLANRALLEDRLARALAELGRAGPPVGVLFIDLDHFKFINDSLGHGAGDMVLKTIADRLETALRDVDTVARFGGDEFVVVCRLSSTGSVTAGSDHVAELSGIAQRILELVSIPMLIGGQSMTMTASVGIAICQDSGSSDSALLGDADAALYLAKGRGRNQFAFFDGDMRRTTDERIRTERDLRQAIDEGHFGLYYQPIVDLHTGRVQGLEALLRWARPDGSIVLPDEFLGIAEDTGLIVPIGRLVLDDATRMLAHLQADPTLPTTYIAINTTARQLSSPDFVDEVCAALARAGADARGLVIEITEQSLIVDTKACRDTLEGLHLLGVRIAIDDFGTGHSSLGYIHRFPIDIVKIDRSFISGPDSTTPSTRALVDTVIAMAKILGLQLIAEGIETAEQLARLTDSGCHSGQGWGIARELVAHHVVDFLRSAHSARSPHCVELITPNHLCHVSSGNQSAETNPNGRNQ